MFDIGFFELLLVLGVGLLVLGPSRLPQAVRTFGLWRRRLRNWLQSTRWELEQEMGLDDLERLRRDGYLDAGPEAGEAPAASEAAEAPQAAKAPEAPEAPKAIEGKAGAGAKEARG